MENCRCFPTFTAAGSFVINKDYKIIFDTYDLDKGKVIISEEVVKCFRGQDTSQYDSKTVL